MLSRVADGDSTSVPWVGMTAGLQVARTCANHWQGFRQRRFQFLDPLGHFAISLLKEAFR